MNAQEYTLTIAREDYSLELSVAQQTVVQHVNSIEKVDAVLFAGFKGAPGEKGEKGEKGDPGGGNSERIDFSTSDTWIVNHNYGRYPNIAVYTTGGLTLFGSVLQLNTNQTSISFDEPVAGFVVIS